MVIIAQTRSHETLFLTFLYPGAESRRSACLVNFSSLRVSRLAPGGFNELNLRQHAQKESHTFIMDIDSSPIRRSRGFLTPLRLFER